MHPHMHGLGTVLSPVMKDGTERPIAFGSRSLTKTEQKYSQINKEALALVWAGIKKFQHYLFGRKFTILNDHQPLTQIFHPHKGIPGTTAARLQRYALFLSGFEYEYKRTTQHSNADCLSRLPLDTKVDSFTRITPRPCRNSPNESLCSELHLVVWYRSEHRGTHKKLFWLPTSSEDAESR